MEQRKGDDVRRGSSRPGEPGGSSGPGGTPGNQEQARKKGLFNGGVLSALGQRDYALLWGGALISNIGTWVQTAALLWYVKEVLKSNTWVGAVNMANFLPVLLLVPFSGSLADRHNRRNLIIAGQAVMLLGALALGIAASLKVDSKAVILITVSVIGIAFAMNFPAWQSLMPDLVGREDLLNAIALSSAQWNLARFIGPFIGAAILVYFSAATAFYTNAVSFLFVIAALFVIHPSRGAVQKSTDSLSHHVMEGWRYVWDRKWMVNLLLALTVISVFGFSYLVLIPGLVKDVLHKGGGSYGIVLGMTGLGAAIGAPALTYLNRYMKERNVIKISTVALGLLLFAFAACGVFWITCVISLGLGFFFLLIGSATNSVLQGCSERAMRGRVVSFYIMVFIGAAAPGGQLVAYIADKLSTPWSLTMSGIMCILTGVVLVAFPTLIAGAVYQGRDHCYEPGA